MLRYILFVGVGGFFGSIARYALNIWMGRLSAPIFPFSTLLINVIGCLMIGLIYSLADRNRLASPEVLLLLGTGFCGSFTTFSAFALENLGMFNRGETGFALAYIGLSLVLGLLAVYGGILAGKLF